MNFEQKILELLSSRYCIIYITTEEEERLEYTLNNISQKKFKQKIYSWNFIDGYTKNPNYKGKSKKNPLEALEIIQTVKNTNTSIFFLKDFNYFINDLSVTIKLKNISKSLQINNKYIIMNSRENEIPKILQAYIRSIIFPPPNQKEIRLELKRLFTILNINKTKNLDQLSAAYQGFSIEKIRKSISTISFKEISYSKILNIIAREKKQLIEQNKILAYYNNYYNLYDIAGLKNLKKWLKIRKQAFSTKANNYGIKTPKGILLVGIQGTGKSLSAQIIASEWQLPLLKLDVSRIFTGVLGESENRFMNMIQICEQVAPCILWIDEIDKIFMNTDSTNDSGTTNRINNIFLTWLSERISKIFIVATANNLNNLPTELLRKGRFDEIFFVQLPKFHERLNIFKIHLRKVRPLTWHKYNLYYLSKISIKFSGAEIEQCITDAMYNAFYEHREFQTNDIKNSIKKTIPLSFTKNIEISLLEEWLNNGKIRKA